MNKLLSYIGKGVCGVFWLGLVLGAFILPYFGPFVLSATITVVYGPDDDFEALGFFALLMLTLIPLSMLFWFFANPEIFANITGGLLQ